MGDILKLYFKDLRVNIQRKIRKFFEKHDIDTYEDEKGEKRNIDEMYDSKVPFFGFIWLEEVVEDRSAMDGMVS